MPAIMVIVFAVAYLLMDLGAFSWNVFKIIWPILLIIAAGSKMGGCGCCKKQA